MNYFCFTDYKFQLLKIYLQVDTFKRVLSLTNAQWGEQWQQLSKKIVMKAIFHETGHIHQHNVRINADDSPFVFIEQNHKNLKINMWCALIHERAVGHSFVKRTVVSQSYLCTLESYTVTNYRQKSYLSVQWYFSHCANTVY